MKKLASIDLIHSHDLMRIDESYIKHLPDVVKDLWIIFASDNREAQVVLVSQSMMPKQLSSSVTPTSYPQSDRYSALSL